jgi:hypothetical protein
MTRRINTTEPKRTGDTRGLVRVLFGEAIPFGHSAVTEIQVGKLGVKHITWEGETIIVVVETEKDFNTLYYIPWSRVACAW